MLNFNLKISKILTKNLKKKSENIYKKISVFIVIFISYFLLTMSIDFRN